MPSLDFDELSIMRAVANVTAYGAAHELGSSIGTAIVGALAGHELVVRHVAESPSRDQLAAMAMQGLVADPNVRLAAASDCASVARLAHQVAAAMLAERERLAVAPTPQPQEHP